MNLNKWSYYIQEVFLWLERFLYLLVGFGVLLSTAFIVFFCFKGVMELPYHPDFIEGIIKVLDKFLIAMMFLEIFYTLQVIFGEEYKIKCLEPFLLVLIIALVRRMLIIGFEISHFPSFDPLRFKYYLIEIIVIGSVIFILIGGIVLLRKSRVSR